MFLGDHKLSALPRPGISLKKLTSSSGVSPLVRPTSNAGRPVTGVVRPNTSRLD